METIAMGHGFTFHQIGVDEHSYVVLVRCNLGLYKKKNTSSRYDTEVGSLRSDIA